jgi:5-formyltetrahydrofolate cyclo-ligase
MTARGQCRREIVDKSSLRAEAMRLRDSLEDRERRSAAICERVAALPGFVAARAIHCYLPMRSEVDTRPLIAAALAHGKRVAVPIVVSGAGDLAHAWLDSLDAGALVPGVFGTSHPREARPASPGDWDLTIVPLLAFDRRGRRLGYGKGYYDRLLAASPTIAVGVGFAAQEAVALPATERDVSLDWIVTENEVIQARR